MSVPPTQAYRQHWNGFDEDSENEPDESKAIAEKPRYLLRELGQVPPSVPIRWIDKHKSEWPYPNPAAEFIASIHLFSMHELAARWEGFVTLSDLEYQCAAENWKVKRFNYQQEVINQACKESFADNVELQKNIINQDIINASLFIDLFVSDVQKGKEYVKNKNAGPHGYSEMPMTVDSKAKLGKVFATLSDLRATRMGQATSIGKVDVDAGEGLSEILSQRRAEQDQAYALLLEQAGLKTLMPSQVESELKERDVVPPEIAVNAEYEED